MKDIRSGNDIPLRWTVNGLDEVQGNRIVQLINSDSGHVARFDSTIDGNVISGNSSGLIVKDNDISGTANNDITLGGTQTNAVVKNNTYMGTAVVTATFDGITKWVDTLS